MIYFVGIKGVGMTALAQVLQARGHQVSGSDVSEVFMTDQVLAQAGIRVFSPFDIKNIPASVDYAVVSGAYYQANQVPSHPEVLELMSRQIPILTYSQVLGKLSEEFSKVLAVAGSHGKTTTSAMLAYSLEQLGADPFAIIGSVVPQFQGNARIGSPDSAYLVMESDEYQNHFLDTRASNIIILNVDYDHPDFFPSEQLYYQAFIRLIETLPPDQALIINGDDLVIAKSILPAIQVSNRKIISFGLADYNQVRLTDDQHLWVDQVDYGRLNLLIPGQHNRLNALAVIALLVDLGYQIPLTMRAVSQFRGTKRRLEYIGQTPQGAVIIDDYAHHPKEIRASLQAIAERYPNKKVHCIFQPHTFSRTELFIKEFAQALDLADHVYLLPIYSSARESVGEVKSEAIMAQMQLASVDLYLDQSAVIQTLAKQNLQQDSLVVTMGAGDVWKITQNML